MEIKEFFGLQLKLINKIISSIDELIPVLKRNDELDETIFNTIYEIFRFLFKLLGVIPDILVSEQNYNGTKNELLVAHDKVIKAWGDYLILPEEFFRAWEEFLFKWKNFETAIEHIIRSGNTIYLSMN